MFKCNIDNMIFVRHIPATFPQSDKLTITMKYVEDYQKPRNDGHKTTVSGDGLVSSCL